MKSFKINRRFWPGFLLIIFIANHLSNAQDLQFSGYVKYLFSSSKTPLLAQRLDDQLLHFRLNSHYYFSDQWEFALETRTRIYYGNSVEKIPHFKTMTKHHYPFKNLGWEFLSGNKTFGYAEIDRGYLNYQGQNFEATLGRQRIAWGTSLVWNVIDLFNPMSILDFDYEEHPGADALRIQYFTGPVSHVELAVEPHPQIGRSTWALMWATHRGEYDFYFLGGQKQKRRVLGFAFSGYLKDAGFRGELKFSDAPSTGLEHFPSFLESLKDNSSPNIQAVLSFDDAFANSFYTHSEVYYNRDGLTSKIVGLYWNQIQAVDMLSPARWSLFQEFGYDLTPLLRADVFALVNPLDHSFLTAPSLSWNALTNLDVYFIAFLTQGSALSEFGSMGRAVYLRFKYSF